MTKSLKENILKRYGNLLWFVQNIKRQSSMSERLSSLNKHVSTGQMKEMKTELTKSSLALEIFRKISEICPSKCINEFVFKTS